MRTALTNARDGATMTGRPTHAGLQVSVRARRQIASTSAISASLVAVSLLLPELFHGPGGASASGSVHVMAAGLYGVAALLAVVSLVRTVRYSASMGPADRLIGIFPAVLVTVVFVLFFTVATGASRGVFSWV
jgi:hypothetical protein